MVRYYFDTRDNETFVADEIGVDLDSFEQVKRMASAAMADFAKDVLPGATVRILMIEVRNDVRPVLRVRLRFEIEEVPSQEPQQDGTNPLNRC